MTKPAEPADPYEIAAMKKAAPGQVDLMRPGNGTPWEDRGTLGLPAAFLKTCFQSMVRPALLLDHLRRPETTGDATGFAIGCSIMWALGVLVWDVIQYFQVAKIPGVYVNGQQYWMETALRCVAAAVAVLLWLRFCTGVFNRLSASELKGARPVLTYNLFAYCLGPSLLAVIPYAGMPLAAAWILVNMMVAGRKRLYMSTRGAVINAILTFLCAAVILAAAYFVLWFLWRQPFSNPVELPQPKPTLPGVTSPAPSPAP